MGTGTGSADVVRPSLTRQAGLLLSGKVIGFAFSFIAPLLIVRTLSQKDFGLYKQIFLVLATSARVLPLAFHMNAFYFLPRQPARGTKIVLNILIVYVLVGLLGMGVLMLYPDVLQLWFGAAELISYAPMVGVALFFMLCGFFLEYVATANQDVGYSTVFIVGSQFTRGLAMVAAALLAGTIEALLYAAIFQSIVQVWVMLWYLQKRFPGFAGRPDWSLMREQLKYAVPFGLAGLAMIMQQELHLYMVAHEFSAAEYAVYAVACANIPLIGLVRESVNSVLLPRMTGLQQQNEKRQMVALLAAGMRKMSLVIWPAYFFLTVTRYEFITLLYTRTYAASVPVFLLNLQTLPLLLLFYDAVLRAYPASTGFLMKMRFITAIFMIPAVYFGIARFGMMGAVSAAVLLMVLDYTVLTWKALRLIEVSRRDWVLFSDILRIAGCAAAGGVAAEGVRRMLSDSPAALAMLVMGILFCCVYIAALALAGVPNPGEMAMLRGKLLQFRRALKMA